MEVQKTALYNIHKNLGAKFVPFAGYEMPIQYKDGIVKEHISTRTYAGFFDVSHMGQFFLEGDETLTEALEKIIPADLKSLKINHSKYSFLLNNDGGIIDDLIVTKTEKGIKNHPRLITIFLKKGRYRLLVKSEPINLYKIIKEIRLRIICIISFNFDENSLLRLS